MMDLSQKPQLIAALKETMGAYGKPLPEAGLLVSWWTALREYPLHIAMRAMSDYCDENGEFPPVPAGIAKRCKVMDGRPGAEEAWAIALTSRDEAETVVWTQEAAEAFSICQPVLQTGDEVGARMAFREAYVRIVTQARQERRPAQWMPSLGWDVRKREAALSKAVSKNLLPAPAVAAHQLSLASISDAAARNQIDKIRQRVADMLMERHIEAEQNAKRERDETAAAKARQNELTANYKKQGDAA